MEACKKRYIIKSPNLGNTGPQGPQGPPGPAAELELPLSTDDVDYRGEVLTDVLDALLYQALVINSFVGTPTVYERGQVVNSIPLTWAYNKSVEVQTITGPFVIEPTLDPSDRNVTLGLSSANGDTTITLTADDVVGDGHDPITSVLQLRWYDGIFWGVGAVPGAYDSAFVLGLTYKNLRATRQGAFSLTVGASQYAFVAIPQDMGAASFKTNGFNGGLSLEAVIAFTNAQGATKNYNIYRTINHSLGFTAFEIL